MSSIDPEPGYWVSPTSLEMDFLAPCYTSRGAALRPSLAFQTKPRISFTFSEDEEA